MADAAVVLLGDQIATQQNDLAWLGMDVAPYGHFRDVELRGGLFQMNFSGAFELLSDFFEALFSAGEFHGLSRCGEKAICLPKMLSK